jgi:cytochrome c peroxidase
MLRIVIILFTVTIISLNFTFDEPVSKVQLGEKLFFDPILSKDSTLSCGTCHKPSLAFADSVAISKGVDGKFGRRNAPSVMNMAFRDAFFYDGRATSLRHQVHFPVEDPLEMNLSFEEAVYRLKKNKVYAALFKKIYLEEPSADNLADAIASFEESLETANTEFDAWMTDQPNTMTESAIRGRSIFMSKRAKCFDCHFSPDFTGDEFKNIGLYDEKKYKDKGRYEVTKIDGDLGKFKVPGLRNVAITAPYMHDGSLKTLKDVVEYYSNPYQFVQHPINMDSALVQAINFSTQEKTDLENFLISLTDRKFQNRK